MAARSLNYIPGLEPKRTEKGNVEVEMEKQINKLRELGLINDAHSGTVALCILAARNVDEMGDRGAPSGRAQLLKSVSDVFAMLPSADDVSDDAVDKIVAAIRG